jgi:DNA processing protein
LTTRPQRPREHKRISPDTNAGIRRIAAGDGDYPVQLAASASAPPELWVRGEIDADDAVAVAVVGSRRATAYGLAIAEEMSRELAARGVTVVSGLARGIDSAAHRGALAAGGRTIAVLGTGVDVIYPAENRRLAGSIAESGALVSQFAPGTPPLAYHFPARNRVIAGLALGVVVVEAAERSGALITAGFAAELGREVMAVPGRVTSPESAGAHRLIQDGAALVTSWEDVVAQLPARWKACVQARRHGPDAREGFLDPVGDGGAAASDDAMRVLGAIGEDPVTIDDVIDRSGLGSGRAAALLLDLELAGRVRQVDGKRFVAAPRG